MVCMADIDTKSYNWQHESTRMSELGIYISIASYFVTPVARLAGRWFLHQGHLNFVEKPPLYNDRTGLEFCTKIYSHRS